MAYFGTRGSEVQILSPRPFSLVKQGFYSEGSPGSARFYLGSTLGVNLGQKEARGERSSPRASGAIHSSGLTRPARINSSRFHERITKRGSVIGPLNNWAHSEMPQDAHARYGRCPTQLPTIRPERAGRERGTETPWKGSHGNLCPVKLSECEAVKGLVKRPALVPQDANCHRFAKQQRLQRI